VGGTVDSIFGGGGGKAAKKAIGFQKDVFNWGKGASEPFIQGGTTAFNTLGGLLGLNGTAFQDDAFKNYMNSTGYKFLLDTGAKAVTTSTAARGLLKSGATLQALTKFGQNLASTKTAEYMGQLQGLAGLGAGQVGSVLGAGNQAASTIAQAGQAGAAAKADAWGSLFNLGLSAAAMMPPSERWLKKDIEKIGEFTKGVGFYLFKYIWGGPTQWGFMVDEIAEHQPWALGPVVSGARTVDLRLVRS
jgi:hypothetical protein